MMKHQKTTLISGVPVAIFIVCLYILWLTELVHISGGPPQNFHDPKELGLLYDLLQPVIIYSMAASMIIFPAILFYIIYIRLVLKQLLHPETMFFLAISYVTYFFLYFYSSTGHPLNQNNPLTALYWFFD